MGKNINIILTKFVRFIPNLTLLLLEIFRMMRKCTIDNELYTDIVRFYGKWFELSPLASKIYAYLHFDFKGEGHSLDELVEIFSASKSSVSTSLHLLKSKRLILDIDKIGERKKFFIINEAYPKIRFTEIVERLKEERKMLKSLGNLSKTENPKIFAKIEKHQELLKRSIDNIEEIINNL